MSAVVVSLADLRARRAGVVDNRTETQQLLAEARTEAYRQGRIDGMYDGMRAAMESMRVEGVPMLDDRRTLKAVPMGGRAS